MTSDRSRNEPNASIVAEASEWLVNFREGDVDAEGRKRFNAWLRRSPEHIQAYMEIAALWGDIPDLAADMKVDVEAVVAWARAQGKVTALNAADRGIRAACTARSGGSPGATTPAIRTRWAIAAALAAITLLAGIIGWLRLNSGTLYATVIGEQRSIPLADGSTVELGPRSRIRVNLSTQERHVDLLAGQAMFRVAKDPLRAFIVATDNTRVRAVGTQFDVHRRSSGTTVTVLEGSVAILDLPTGDSGQEVPGLPPDSSKGHSSLSSDVEPRTDLANAQGPTLYLSAGQQVTVPIFRVPQPRVVEAAGTSAWAERTLSFDNAPLSDVIEEFNRYNEKQLVLTEPALGTLRLSGVFSATKPASLLRFLGAEMQLAVAETDRQINISTQSEKNSYER